MTPTGKIARLPETIRHQLNRRLADGQPAQAILPWLNGLAPVQAVLKQHFQSRPITPQNLSEWRRGGFALWHVEHASPEPVADLPAPAPPKDATTLADEVLSLALDRIQRALAFLSAAPDSPELLACLKALLPNVVHLIRTQHAQAHVKLALAREQRAQTRFEWESLDRQYAFRRRRILAPLYRPLHAERMAFLAGGDPAEAWWKAWLAAASDICG